MRRTCIALMSLAFLAAAEPPDTDAPKKEAPKKEAPKKDEAKKTEAQKHPHYAKGFTLKDTNGKDRTLDEFANQVVVLEWVNHGCPYVKKHYVTGNMQALQKKYTGQGVIWLSICSSAEGKQGHMTPEQWKAANEKMKVHATAVLLDPTGEVGRLYKARTTPQICVIDKKRIKVYEGAIDDQRSWKPASVKDAKNYVAVVLDAMAAGKEIPMRETKPYGCSVKYAK